MSDSDRLRRGFMSLVGGSMATALAGCTSDESPNGENDENGEREVVWVQNEVARTADPHKVTDLQTQVVTINRYDALLYLTEDGTVTDHLATDWESEEEGRVWTFTLRDDVEFHSGNELTADDVAYSMERALAIAEGDSDQWRDVLDPEGIDVVDDYTIRFELDQPFGPFLQTLIRLTIVDSDLVRENETDGDHGEYGDFGQEFLDEETAGSGPYTLAESGEDEIIFERFDGYWRGWEENQFDRARMVRVPEESTVRLMMERGEADITTATLTPEAFEEMGEYDNVEIVTADRLDLFYIPFNTEKPPLDDRNVREAFAYSIDYATINDLIRPEDPIASGPVPQAMPGHNGDLDPYEQDLDRAQEALDRSDYTVEEINDIGIEHVFIASVPYMENIGLVFSEGLNELGIDVELNGQEWPTITERAVDPETAPHTQQLYVFAAYPSPDVYTSGMFHPSAFGTLNGVSHYTTDEIESVLDEARTTSNTEERRELYNVAQELIWEGYPAAFVANPDLQIAKNTSLGGYQHKGVTGYDYYWWDMHHE
ncbi:ABC transporter substrate-binding protein [Natrialba sp. INN-245]|uniref:ABC transporter substrate-binding protein n=1 Tax=Natrialba sp. INN-245 TaxID=2690967 RepID=UPI001311F402|nr:ABC transporter substrate-binding protein [Natrialba sp. INN-245]MWV39780.1 ABC transporter substrate-binding protein [Natrialba sp. INN-245]